MSVCVIFTNIKKEHCSFLLSDKALNHLDCLKIKLSDKNEDYVYATDKQSNVTDELFDLDWSPSAACDGLCSVFSEM